MTYRQGSGLLNTLRTEKTGWGHLGISVQVCSNLPRASARCLQIQYGGRVGFG